MSHGRGLRLSAVSRFGSGSGAITVFNKVILSSIQLAFYFSQVSVIDRVILVDLRNFRSTVGSSAILLLFLILLSLFLAINFLRNSVFCISILRILDL